MIGFSPIGLNPAPPTCAASQCVYLQAFETGFEAQRCIGAWIDYYNRDRPHSGVGGLTQNEAHGTGSGDEKLAT